MSTIQANAILDASGGNTTTINGVTPTSNNVRGRNLIINGAMQVAQRYGYNSAQTDWNSYDASDRIFKRTLGGATSSVQTRDDDAPSGFSFSDKLTITSADSDTYIGRGTCLEWQDINHLRAGYSDAKTVTLSFWVKTSIAGTYCFALTSYVATHSASDASTSYVTEYTVNSANTWEYKTITITMPTSTPSNWDNSNGKNAIGLRLQWSQSRRATTNSYETATTDSWISGNYYCTSNQTNMGATNSSTFQITGIQLEVGSVATEFDHRSYGEELSLCERYFFNAVSSLTNSNIWPIVYSDASSSNTGWTAFQVDFPVSMRVTPTMSHSLSDSNIQSNPSGDNWSFYLQNQGHPGKVGSSNMSVLNSSANHTHANVGAYYVSPNGNASAIKLGSGTTLTFDAEL